MPVLPLPYWISRCIYDRKIACHFLAGIKDCSSVLLSKTKIGKSADVLRKKFKVYQHRSNNMIPERWRSVQQAVNSKKVNTILDYRQQRKFSSLKTRHLHCFFSCLQITVEKFLHTHTHTHAYTHSHTHTCVHTHMHIYIRSCKSDYCQLAILDP